ncbi:hypothetical protein A9K65_021955 [Mesorhizobium sp. WSM1497]|nr:hypothetical protein A9K65_021955 [Mesorhizobium sp. WSM1497]
MSEGHSTYKPQTGIGRWFDTRLPLPRLEHTSFEIGHLVSNSLAQRSRSIDAVHDRRQLARQGDDGVLVTSFSRQPHAPGPQPATLITSTALTVHPFGC